MKNIHILPTDKPICTCERPDYFCDCLLYDEKVKEEPKQSIKDRILSETPEYVKQKVRESANALVNKQETLEEFAERLCPNKQVEYDMIIEGAKWQQDKICNSEVLQRIRATKSDAEARRIIRTL